MSPRLAAAIDAARELAWLPWSNAGGRASWYAQRRDAHHELVRRLSTVRSANASPELVAVVECIRRVAACTFSNRFGEPYAERRDAIRKLRGAFATYDEEVRFRERERATRNAA